ncbi:hypothetical protein ES708_05402 [subsurface metagenome]
MKPKDEDLKVVFNWRPTVGEPSPLLRRLWGKLLGNRKNKPASTRQEGGNGGCKNGNGRHISHE